MAIFDFLRRMTGGVHRDRNAEQKPTKLPSRPKVEMSSADLDKWADSILGAQRRRPRNALENARRLRQIERGQLTTSNGLVGDMRLYDE